MLVRVDNSAIRQSVLYQPAARDRVGDSCKGVSIQGLRLFISPSEPMTVVGWLSVVIQWPVWSVMKDVPRVLRSKQKKPDMSDALLQDCCNIYRLDT